MSTPNDNSPLARLRHHVTGAIAQACIEQAAKLIVEGKDPNGAVLNLNEALAHVDALQAQRDELLAACQTALEMAGEWDGEEPSYIQTLRSAIARATEGEKVNES